MNVREIGWVATEARWVVRRRGSYIFYTNGSQIAARLSALFSIRLAALYPEEDSWYTFLLEPGSNPGP
jgi:hypothetical protein